MFTRSAKINLHVKIKLVFYAKAQKLIELAAHHRDYTSVCRQLISILGASFKVAHV